VNTGEISVKCLPKGHIDFISFYLVGSGIQTSDLLVTDPMLLTVRPPATPVSYVIKSLGS
jgi:uncharacterized protein with ACT and thioredoxin-like domain